MDKWEDYPIKVLDMAPLIIVTIPTVSSFSSTCGCFLRVERSFSQTISLLFSLACGWPLRQTTLCFCEWWCLQQLRVEGSSGARKGGRTDPRSGPGRLAWDDRPRPIRPCSVAPSLPWVLMCLCTLPPPLAPFSWCHPRVQDGCSPCMKSSLLRFNPRGCSFVTLPSLPPLGVISSSS
jgi:hypothetical protein